MVSGSILLNIWQMTIHDHFLVHFHRKLLNQSKISVKMILNFRNGNSTHSIHTNLLNHQKLLDIFIQTRHDSVTKSETFLMPLNKIIYLIDPQTSKPLIRILHPERSLTVRFHSPMVPLAVLLLHKGLMTNS